MIPDGHPVRPGEGGIAAALFHHHAVGVAGAVLVVGDDVEPGHAAVHVLHARYGLVQIIAVLHDVAQHEQGAHPGGRPRAGPEYHVHAHGEALAVKRRGMANEARGGDGDEGIALLRQIDDRAGDILVDVAGGEHKVAAVINGVAPGGIARDDELVTSQDVGIGTGEEHPRACDAYFGIQLLEGVRLVCGDELRALAGDEVHELLDAGQDPRGEDGIQGVEAFIHEYDITCINSIAVRRSPGGHAGHLLLEVVRDDRAGAFTELADLILQEVVNLREVVAFDLEERLGRLVEEGNGHELGLGRPEVAHLVAHAVGAARED